MSKEAKKRILVVADDPDTLIFLANLLRCEGFDPCEAESTVDAVHQAKSRPPDIVIIDMMMAEERGIHLYRCLKGNEPWKRIPVIMLCTIERETFFQFHNIQKFPSGRALPLPDAYLMKPFETAALLKTVKKLTSARRIQTPAMKRMEA